MPNFKLSILKLIDEAVLPAAIVVGVKLISFVILAIGYGLVINFPRDLASLVLLRVDGVGAENLLLANSVSSLFSLMAVLIFFGLVVIKAHHFHISHVSPRFHQKLIKRGWDHLLEESHEIYHQGLVWFAFSWLFLFHVVAEALLGLAFWWVPFITLAVVFSLTMMMIEDVINEMKMNKTQTNR